jgi:hypothetical protein
MHDATIAGVDPAADFVPAVIKLSDGYTAVPINKPAVNKAKFTLRDQIAKETSAEVIEALEGDIAALNEALENEADRKAAYPLLQQRYSALSDAAKDMYTKVRDAYVKRNEDTLDGMLERINALDLDGRKKAELALRLRANFENSKVNAPYFPLARFGKFWLSGKKSDGKGGVETIFELAETQQEQTTKANRMALDGYKIERGRSLDTAKAVDGASGTFVAKITEAMRKAGVQEAALDEVYQLYLRSLPDLSTRKQFIHRKKTAGYSDDALRAFAHHMDHSAYQVARMVHGPKLEALLTRAAKEAKELSKSDSNDGNKAAAAYNELARRHEWVMNPKNASWVNKLSSVNFAFYLGASPAAGLVNLTQTALITFPTVAAKYGFVKAANMLFGTTGASIKSLGKLDTTLTGEDLDAYKALSAMGAIDTTLAHDQAGIADVPTDEYNATQRKIMEKVSWIFHIAEKVNREASGIGAFRLARQNGQSFESAVKYAADIIHDTHYDYSNANRARFMQADWQKVLFAFKQYSQSTTFFLWRTFYESIKGETPEVKAEARKRMAGVLGMSAMFSGALGLPLMSLSFSIANAMASVFGDEDDPWDAETEFRNFLADYLGNVAGDIAQNGLIEGGLNALGLPAPALADRVKLDQLWFRPPDEELTAREMGSYVYEQMGGPIIGMGLSMFKAAGHAANGELWRGVETAMPKTVRDAMKAIRFETDGVTTLRGDALIEDVSIGEVILQANGFSSARIAEVYRRNSATKNYEDAIMSRRSKLIDAYAMMIQNDDQDGIRSAIQAIVKFNRTNPTVAVNASSLRSSIRTRQRYSEQMVNGVVRNEKLKRQSEQAVRF